MAGYGNRYKPGFASFTQIYENRFLEASDEDLLDAHSDEDAEAEADQDSADLSSVDSISLYLQEMARVPLLTDDEEVFLAKRYEAGQEARQKLAQDPFHPEAAAWEAMVQDGMEAREHIIKANTRLVVSIAKRYMNQGVPFLDLIQEGNLGLMKAVEKFDYTRGFRFSTYATWWIRQMIARAVADQSRAIRVPAHMTEQIRNLYRIAYELEQETGCRPSIEEVAQKAGIQSRKAQWLLHVSRDPLSLEQPVGGDEDSELGNFIENDKQPTPVEVTTEKLLHETMEYLLNTLSPREAQVLRLRFGLQNGRVYTLEEVGEKFGLTRERIRQIEGCALRRLRHPNRSRLLKDYM